eukprot:SAG31_NODE_20935_length_561_cov_2.567100_1_plen_28_part_01
MIRSCEIGCHVHPDRGGEGFVRVMAGIV